MPTLLFVFFNQQLLYALKIFSNEINDAYLWIIDYILLEKL
jgi:hypothetical protein